MSLGRDCPLGTEDAEGEHQVLACSNSLIASLFSPTWFLTFTEKMAFVGFKGSFRPIWVTLETDDHKAKIFQVVPIPVVRKKKL